MKAAVGQGRTTVLLTGFGPFPRVPVNATMLMVPRVAAAARLAFPGVVVVDRILPTEWERAPQLVDEMLDEIKPDVVLHFGVSGRARGFEIETRGVNACADAADAVGSMPRDGVIDRGLDAALPSRFPAAEIVRRLRRRGIAAYLSRDAGTYLCNRTLFHSLSVFERHDDLACVGFVHVPDALAGLRMSATTKRPNALAKSPLDWRDAIAGGVEIVGACLGRSPVHRPDVNPSRS